MQKYAVLYVKYAEVYLLHILHLYALPIFLMSLHGFGQNTNLKTTKTSSSAGKPLKLD